MASDHIRNAARFTLGLPAAILTSVSARTLCTHRDAEPLSRHRWKGTQSSLALLRTSSLDAWTRVAQMNVARLLVSNADDIVRAERCYGAERHVRHAVVGYLTFLSRREGVRIEIPDACHRPGEVQLRKPGRQLGNTDDMLDSLC